MEERRDGEDATWVTAYAAALAGAAPGEDLLTPRLHGQVLALARNVAHGSERRNAPVAAFLAGRFVAARVADGASAEDALREAAAAAQRLLPPATP